MKLSLGLIALLAAFQIAWLTTAPHGAQQLMARRPLIPPATNCLLFTWATTTNGENHVTPGPTNDGAMGQVFGVGFVVTDTNLHALGSNYIFHARRK